jgi:hypothetical protein
MKYLGLVTEFKHITEDIVEKVYSSLSDKYAMGCSLRFFLSESKEYILVIENVRGHAECHFKFFNRENLIIGVIFENKEILADFNNLYRLLKSVESSINFTTKILFSPLPFRLYKFEEIDNEILNDKQKFLDLKQKADSGDSKSMILIASFLAEIESIYNISKIDYFQRKYINPIYIEQYLNYSKIFLNEPISEYINKLFHSAVEHGEKCLSKLAEFYIYDDNTIDKGYDFLLEAIKNGESNCNDMKSYYELTKNKDFSEARKWYLIEDFLGNNQIAEYISYTYQDESDKKRQLFWELKAVELFCDYPSLFDFDDVRDEFKKTHYYFYVKENINTEIISSKNGSAENLRNEGKFTYKGEFNYYINSDNKVVITDFNNSKQILITIPEKIDGYEVYSIEKFDLEGCWVIWPNSKIKFKSDSLVFKSSNRFYIPHTIKGFSLTVLLSIASECYLERNLSLWQNLLVSSNNFIVHKNTTKEEFIKLFEESRKRNNINETSTNDIEVNKTIDYDFIRDVYGLNIHKIPDSDVENYFKEYDSSLLKKAILLLNAKNLEILNDL